MTHTVDYNDQPNERERWRERRDLMLQTSLRWRRLSIEMSRQWTSMSAKRPVTVNSNKIFKWNRP